MPHSIFALEVCLRLGPHSTLPSELRRLVVSQPAASTYQAKWSLYRQACDILLANLASVEKGCWDYFDDDARAQRDYKMWTDGLLTEEGARKAPSWQGGADPYRSAAQGYMTFTMAFLLAKNTRADLEQRARCNVHEALLWRRDVFAHLIQGVPLLNFASVKSDVIYVIPGDERWSLTAEDLVDPKFHYLRPLE